MNCPISLKMLYKKTHFKIIMTNENESIVLTFKDMKKTTSWLSLSCCQADPFTVALAMLRSFEQDIEYYKYRRKVTI